MFHAAYTTAGGLKVVRTAHPVEDGPAALAALAAALDEGRGAILESSFEAPGRYRKAALGFVDPPLALTGRGEALRLEALNARGRLLRDALAPALAGLPGAERLACNGDYTEFRIPGDPGDGTEETRTRRSGTFAGLRAVLAALGGGADPHLGLYGAFAYDLVQQFEPLTLRHARPADQRDLVLYLPDSLLVLDAEAGGAVRYDYEFSQDGRTTRGLPREGRRVPLLPAGRPPADPDPARYREGVERARAAFARGDLFEVVLSQCFHRACTLPPSRLYGRLREANPAPYGGLLSLGEGEHLVAASPEMFVRVAGRRVETCPISGSAPRGGDALADAEAVRSLLNSAKEEAELTMCTDVDRNDKSRICEPGSIRIRGRRLIESYARVIHTVDHVEGTLAAGYDGLDAFLSHAWAVTVTGAPKPGAMQFIEDHEDAPRRWYGGAFGVLRADGGVDTGLTIRTLRIAGGLAEMRAGATLLHASDPATEEAETRLKAAALLEAVDGAEARPAAPRRRAGAGRLVLLVDHRDSFVLTLAGYFRATGAAVTTLRAGFPPERLAALRPDLVVLSPGPGRPADFGTAALLDACLALGLPVFGVCLGLQAMVEHAGGRLARLETPAHGIASPVRLGDSPLFAGLPPVVRAGRYHSLHAERAALPAALRVTAEGEGGIVMAVEHAAHPWAAVQFHPESLLSQHDEFGLTLIENVVSQITAPVAKCA